MSPNANSFFKNLKHDLPSGIVVFFVALPLCLGISLASGAPLFSGVLSGIIGGIIIGIASGSNVSVSGPAAGLAVIVFTSINALNSFEGFLLAVVMAGILQIVLGFLRAGIIALYFPNAVIKGMLAAIGIILILKQVPHAVGFDFDYEGDESFLQNDQQNTITELLQLTNYLNIGAVLISALSFIILLLWDRPFVKNNPFLKYIPGSLLVVVTGVSMNLMFEAHYPDLALKKEHLVTLPIIHDVGSLIRQFTFPDFTFFKNVEVYKIAFTIAIVASIESLLSIEAADKIDPMKRVTPPNRELVAQGLGNIASGLIGGLPVTAVIVRSSANINSGARTKASAIIHGLLLLFSVLFFNKELSNIPLACLASILILIGYKLASLNLFKSTYKLGFDQFIPFTVTILGVVFTDLLKGVAFGSFVSIIFILRHNFKSPYKMIREEIDGQLHVFVKLSQNVTFINKGKIRELLYSMPKGSKIVIDGGRSTFIDKDVLELIGDFKHTAHYRQVEVETEEIEDIGTISSH